MRPDASMAVDGSGLDRMPAGSPARYTVATLTAPFHDLPPSVEANAMMPLPPSSGTITVPFGWTSGSPPSPASPLAVVAAADQCAPPSVDVLIMIRSPPAG